MEVSNTIDAVSIVNIHVCHVYKSVLDDVCALIRNLLSYFVVKLADDWHKLWNSLLEIADWPLL